LALGQSPRGTAAQREARRFLYRDPHLPSLDYFSSLAQSLLRADKQWDDLRSSPHSLPGAFVQTLDLSHIASASATTSDAAFNPWRFTSTLSTILPLIPNLRRLVLPAPESYMLGATTLLRLLDKADFQPASLRELENLPVFANGLVTHEGLDPVVELLLAMPNLERLGVVGGGTLDFADGGAGAQAAGLNPDDQPLPVNLPRLASLSLRGIPAGLLLQTLLASDLPALRKLEISSYHTHPGELTTALLQAHGSKLATLAFLPLPDFPALHFALPESTLDLCPSVGSLTFQSLPNNVAPPAGTFFASRRPGSLTIRHLTLPRPPRTSSTTYADLLDFLLEGGSVATPGSRPVVALPSLETVAISPGFLWVPAIPQPGAAMSVSSAAANAGLNGLIRQYAVRLGRRGVRVLDARGRACPGLTTVDPHRPGEGWRDGRLTPITRNEGAGGALGAAAGRAWRERRRSLEPDDESDGGG